MITEKIRSSSCAGAALLYEQARHLPKRTGGRALGQPVDIPLQPVGIPVHSLCKTSGDAVTCALSSSDNVINSCGGRKSCPA